jgi:hypothetical protein
LVAVKDSKAKGLLLKNLRKLCDKYEIDYFEIDDHLTYAENRAHILSIVGKTDQADMTGREIGEYAHAIDLDQSRLWLVKRAREPRVRKNIIHLRRRDVSLIQQRLKARGFPSIPTRFYLSVVGEPELVREAVGELRDSGYLVRYAGTTRNHRPFAYPLYF